MFPFQMYTITCKYGSGLNLGQTQVSTLGSTLVASRVKPGYKGVKSELKMAELGQTCQKMQLCLWSGQSRFQRQLLKAVKNVHLFSEITEDLCHQGYDQHFKQAARRSRRWRNDAGRQWIALGTAVSKWNRTMIWKTLMSDSGNSPKFTV